MEKKSLLFLVFSVLLAGGCSYPLQELGLYKTDGAGIPGLGSLQTKAVNFETVKLTAMRTCLECHTSGSRSMDTAEEVLVQKESILSAVHKESMPPRSSGYKPLTACEKQILETWIEDQTHERKSTQKVGQLAACAGVEAPKEKPKTDLKSLELSFANLQAEIFGPKCMACHSQERAKRTVLEDVNVIREKGFLKEKAEDSILYQIVVPGLYKRFMPPQNGKYGIAPLTADEVDYLKRWIDAGAPL
ncbi:hypothetical protein [Bdellovibrio bacteriovorus]|uniref:hypothetical protein n=1 Tax=Bdellovibrio bacteriovorus TaxID=959 RepID=UPI0035A6374B